MGKNKGKGKKKDNPVFKVAGAKVSKSKQKAAKVATNLKRINIQNKTKTEAMDAKFADVQKDLLYRKKSTQESEKSSTKSKVKVMDEMPAPVDMDSALEQFSQL